MSNITPIVEATYSGGIAVQHTSDAIVEAYPQNGPEEPAVYVDVRNEGELTPAQARQVASSLLRAADVAEGRGQ